MCKGDYVTHPKRQKSFYRVKLTEAIDCPYKPTSRDPIYLSFRSSVVKDTFYSDP